MIYRPDIGFRLSDKLSKYLVRTKSPVSCSKYEPDGSWLIPFRKIDAIKVDSSISNHNVVLITVKVYVGSETYSFMHEYESTKMGEPRITTSAVELESEFVTVFRLNLEKVWGEPVQLY